MCSRNVSGVVVQHTSPAPFEQIVDLNHISIGRTPPLATTKQLSGISELSSSSSKSSMTSFVFVALPRLILVGAAFSSSNSFAAFHHIQSLGYVGQQKDLVSLHLL
jgi:hypothetical protein